MSFKLASEEDIYDILHGIKTNAYGIDDINSQMLKYSSPFIDKYITHIVNCCIEANYFPDPWKISIGKPLSKVANPVSFNDLRIISILPVLSKVMEKLLSGQLYEHCISHKILPDYQCGFRKGFSTAVALTNVTDDIFLATDKKQCSVLVLLDYSKAFVLLIMN